MKKILRLPEVKDRTGLSRSLIYKLIAQDKFPKQIKLTDRASGWSEQSINDWIAQRITESEAA